MRSTPTAGVPSARSAAYVSRAMKVDRANTSSIVGNVAEATLTSRLITLNPSAAISM